MSKGLINKFSSLFIPYQINRNCIRIFQGDHLIWEYNAINSTNFLKYDALNIYNSFRASNIAIQISNESAIYDQMLWYQDNLSTNIIQSELDPIVPNYDRLYLYNDENIDIRFIVPVGIFDQDYTNVINITPQGSDLEIDATYDQMLWYQDNLSTNIIQTELDPIISNYDMLYLYNDDNIDIRFIISTGNFDQEYINTINITPQGSDLETDAIYDQMLWYQDNLSTNIIQTELDPIVVNYDMLYLYNDDNIDIRFIDATGIFDQEYTKNINITPHGSDLETDAIYDQMLWYQDNLSTNIIQSELDPIIANYDMLYTYTSINISTEFVNIFGSSEIDFNQDFNNTNYNTVF